jgi:DNA-binding NarL/FixJ family response regulator
VVLIDGNISNCCSNEATQKIKGSFPKVQVAMLTDSENEQELFSAIESGATGYLLKDIRVDDLIKSVDLIGKGEVIISHPLGEKLVGKFVSLREKEPEHQTGLTQQELQIVKLLVKGATNKEIAGTLFITENTAKVHLKNILVKLGLRNRQQVAAYAVQQGLVAEITNAGENPG